MSEESIKSLPLMSQMLPCTLNVTFPLGENCSASFTDGKLRFREIINFTEGKTMNLLSLKNPSSF